jgi:hypothetical protein
VFDDWNVKPGEIISLKVDEGLEQSRVLLLCMSPNALASNWVALERSTAIHRDPSNEGRRFIPLLLADCNLPDPLRRYKYLDFREESSSVLAELLVACRTNQTFDIYLVIRQGDEITNAQTIRWMNVTRHLKERSNKTTRQIPFTGEKLDMEALWKVRDQFFPKLQQRKQ